MLMSIAVPASFPPAAKGNHQWDFAVLLWELVTREVPFADLSNMEIGMKVRA